MRVRGEGTSDRGGVSPRRVRPVLGSSTFRVPGRSGLASLPHPGGTWGKLTYPVLPFLVCQVDLNPASSFVGG